MSTANHPSVELRIPSELLHNLNALAEFKMTTLEELVQQALQENLNSFNKARALKLPDSLMPMLPKGANVPELAKCLSDAAHEAGRTEDPCYKIYEWQRAVAEGSLLGYWEWVATRIIAQEDDAKEGLALVLVTVRGGVAEYTSSGNVKVAVFDFDNWEATADSEKLALYVPKEFEALAAQVDVPTEPDGKAY